MTVICLAKTHQQFRFCKNVYGKPDENWVYASSDMRIRGIKKYRVERYGEYWMHPNHEAIEITLKHKKHAGDEI
jgi:hypothetical protein